MKNKKIIIIITAIVLLIAVIITSAAVKSKKNHDLSEGTTAPQEIVTAYVTENKRKGLKLRRVNELTVRDSGSDDTLTIAVEGAKGSETVNGGMVFSCDDAFEKIKASVEKNENEEIKTYIYGNRMRIDKYRPDGKIATYSVVKTTDEDGGELYDLSDCRAFLVTSDGKYCSFKLPYYFLSESENLSGLDYLTPGTELEITVSKAEFLKFYEDSGLYIISEPDENSFVLEHTYAVSDKGNGYPVRFEFEGNRVIIGGSQQ